MAGPLFACGDAWHLVISTGTTISTVLIRNRDTRARQPKLDELIRAAEGAHNRPIALEGQGDQVTADLASACDAVRPSAACPAG